MTSLFESLLVALFVFGFAPAKSTSSVLVIGSSCGVFLGTIIWQLDVLLRNRKECHNVAASANRGTSRELSEHPLVQSDSEATKLLEDDSGPNSAEFDKPWRRFFAKSKTQETAMSTAFVLEVLSIAFIIVVIVHMVNSDSSRTPKLWKAPCFIPAILVFLSIVWCPPVQKYLSNPVKYERLVTSARWKAGVLNGLWRLIFIPAFSFAVVNMMTTLDKENERLSYFKAHNLFKGIRHITGDWNYLAPFLVNVFSTFGAYLFAWLAYALKMHLVGFVGPVLLSTPISIILVVTLCGCKHVNFPLSCPEISGYLITSVILLWVVQSIYLLVHVYRFKTVALMREEDLFLYSYYNGPFIEQSLLLNRNVGLDCRSRKLADPVRKSREARVFICTTMYRESIEEQRQLLHSIYAIVKCLRMTPAHKIRHHFESHIYFDDGANGMYPSRYAYQLMSLVEETLHGKLNEMEKYETPYGIQLHWMLGGDFPFYLHLKDPRKYKKGKRWSQVMYMSYILNYRQNQDDLDEDNTFILTTDGDVIFTPESVEILIDRLLRDHQVGAVCGRTHPVGNSPIVW